MIEAEVVRLMREHLESQFPKVCPTCQRHFASLYDYIQNTYRVEPSISYDAEVGDWNPKEPIGTATYSTCPCGSTLALSSHGMPLLRLWALYNWARVEKAPRHDHGATSPLSARPDPQTSDRRRRLKARKLTQCHRTSPTKQAPYWVWSSTSSPP
jgi:hypothetical protein